MPLLLWPFPSGVPGPPVFPRAPTGKVFVVDEVHNYFFGPSPYVNESCSMVFNVGPGMPPPQTPVRLFFLDPNGNLQLGNPAFAFINTLTITELFPNMGFPAGQAIIYTFGVGELSIIGRWSVNAIVGAFVTNTVTFLVTPKPLMGVF